MTQAGNMPSTAEEAIAMMAQVATQLTHQSVPMVQPMALLGLVQAEMASQDKYERVLQDLVDPEAQQRHPFWGFYIQGKRSDNTTVELARTLVPKVLDPKDPSYLQTLAAWSQVYMLVSTPAVRALWRACGFQVHFFQGASSAGPKAPSPLALA